MKFKEKIYLSYDDTLSMMKNLEYEVSKMRPDLIVGIARGGLLPALHLSHALDVPLECMYWSTRDSGMKTYSSPVEEELQAGRTVVFVDDINDTGLTFHQIKMEYGTEGTSKFVSLVEKTSSKFTTDARALRMDDERWIVFPWEKD
jgi:hypoxanthine phosphoribosyltransferase